MDQLISVAKTAKKKFDKKINPLTVVFDNPNENVEFAAWHRVAHIECDTTTTISSYQEFLNKIKFESIDNREITKKKILEDSKFIDISNNPTNELFGKIVDDLKNGNAIKIKSNLESNTLDKHKFIIDYDNIDYEAIEKINKGVTEINNDIINDTTIDNIKNKKNTIRCFNFSKIYEEDFSKFNADYSCNINDSANVDDQDAAGGQDTAAGQVQVGGYNKYLKNKKKSKRKKNKVKKGGAPFGYPQEQPIMLPQPQPVTRIVTGSPMVTRIVTGAPMGSPMGSPMGAPMGAPMVTGYYSPMAAAMPSQMPWWITMPGQNSQPQDQTENYSEGIEKHTDAILIITNDKKKRIEFYKPINITKIQRLKLIVKSKSDREKEALKEASRERLDKIDGKTKEELMNYKNFNILVQAGGNFTWDDIINAINYTPIPIYSLRTVHVKNGLWNFEKCDDDGDYNIIEYENNRESHFEPLKDYLTKTFKKIEDDNIKNIKDKKEYFTQQLNLTDYKNIKDLENDKYKYVFNIYDENSNSNHRYCYKSSDIIVYLINTSAEYIESKDRLPLTDFKIFEEKINEKIEKLKEREKLILSVVNENVKINTNRVETIDEKDKERFDNILFKFLEFLAYLIKNIMIWLKELILISFKLFIEVYRTFSGIVSGWFGNKWGNVVSGVVIFLIMLAIFLGIFISNKGSPKRNTKIDESNNVNRKTLYSIITALPTDISNAYNDFVKFAGTVNTMLFDAKKTINEMTTESGYFENSELLTDRSKLADTDHNRVDYIMHFFDDTKKNVWHSYKPIDTTTTIGTNSITNGIITFTEREKDKKYIINCTENDYFKNDCKRKILPNCETSVLLQETVQQTQPEEKDFRDDYDMIKVDKN